MFPHHVVLAGLRAPVGPKRTNDSSPHRGFAAADIDECAQRRGCEAPWIIEAWPLLLSPPVRQYGNQGPGAEVIVKPVAERADDAQPGTGVAQSRVQCVHAQNQARQRLHVCRFVSVSQRPGKKRSAGAGMPAGSIAVMLGYYRAARAGEFRAIDPTLARLLGRAPETMSCLLYTSDAADE